MATSPFDHPGLTIALAMAMGMIAQAVGHHLRVPGIVLLLAVAISAWWFGLVPDVLTLAGTALIAVAGVYLAWSRR